MAERAQTLSLKRVAVGLPEESVSRALIMRLPDEMLMVDYLAKAEELSSVLFAEMRAAEAAKQAFPAYRRVARAGAAVASESV